MIEYYTRIAPVMLPHIGDRALTLRRYPDGVEGKSFFEKRCPSHRPDWVSVAIGPGDRNGTIEYCRLDETAALVDRQPGCRSSCIRRWLGAAISPTPRCWSSTSIPRCPRHHHPVLRHRPRHS
ncbi:MAG: hypothetical protein R2710_11185 [Acidimicrobiales bacterium]